MLADYHIHSEFSDDSEYPMEEAVKDAVALGLEEICFTEHVDYGVKRDWDDPRGMAYRHGKYEGVPFANANYPLYVRKIAELREKYEGQISVKLGLEFGLQFHTIGEYENLFARYPFDFILLSIHEIDDQEFWSGEFQNGKTQEECYLRYYEEMLKIVRNFKNYSVLAHMDLIARYDNEVPFPFRKVKPLVEDILRQVIDDGKGIELNTSSAQYGVASTPSEDILKLYRDLGGDIITIGSDAHQKARLGSGILNARQNLKSLGFRRFCTFDQMKSTFHNL